MTLCAKNIRNGIIFRYIITLVLFYILSIYNNNNIIHNYFYLIAPVMLTVLDSADSIFNFSCKRNQCTKNQCSKTFYYQYLDKICDSVSYLLLFLFFRLDNVVLYFILYRIVGVLLFSLTKNSVWLILFFDFVKEFLLYIFIFKNNYTYLPIFVLGKIAFEYYFHNVINKSQY